MFRLLLLALLAGANAVSAVTIEDANTRYMEADLFKTVTEYLTGNASDGDRVVLRSQPDERSGEYFILTVTPSVAEIPADAVAVLEVIPSNAKSAQTFEFPFGDSPRSSRYLYLGLTGSDWPGETIRPVAWRVRIQQGDATLAEWKSFLWEMP